MRPSRPLLCGFVSTCVFLTSVFSATFASAQAQYGDSVWTGAASAPQQHGAQLPSAAPRQHAAQPQQNTVQRSPHSGYANSPSQVGTQGYPNQPTSGVIQASAQGPARDQTSDENTSVPVGQPVSTGTELTPINGVDRSGAEDQSSGGVLQTIVSIGSSLLIVGGLFFGLVWVYRKTANTTLGGGLPKGVVNVLGRAPIAARQQMVLVRFGHKLVLVSVVQGEARTISEITDPLEVDRLTGLCESAKPDSSVQSFRSFLSEGSKA
ncbi:MAG: hypothetical protein Aurels2KO_22200 [Aureliella sp.]